MTMERRVISWALVACGLALFLLVLADIPSEQQLAAWIVAYVTGILFAAVLS